MNHTVFCRSNHYNPLEVENIRISALLESINNSLPSIHNENALEVLKAVHDTCSQIVSSKNFGRALAEVN
jgi:hypothetical protein